MQVKNSVQCRCNYKCKHFPPGYSKVGCASYYRHEKLSLEGKFHYSVKRSSPLENRIDEAMQSAANNVIFKHCYCTSCKGQFSWSENIIRQHHIDEEKRLARDATHEKNASACQNVLEDGTDDGMIDGDCIDISKAMPKAGIEYVGLGEALMVHVIEMQALLDKCKVPNDCQGEILKRLFTVNDKGVSLGCLLASYSANGGGMNAPTSWKQLTKIYKHLGMIETQKWGICMGDTKRSHFPMLFKPNGINTCTMCSKPKKDCLKFEYLPIRQILGRMCLSQTLCHEFLCMWRNWFTWIGSNVDDTSEEIKEFWHRKRIQEYQTFWDPESYWEGPVLCTNVNCNRSFKAFPETLGCEEVQNNWNEELHMYSFPCCKCRTLIEAPRNVIQGDPRNYALLGHWDGFQSARTRYRDCWTLEVAILNGGKASSLGSMPILFIPASSEKIIKEAGTNVLAAFLEPFVNKLEEIFIHGFPVNYVYPSYLIHRNVVENKMGTSITLRAMLMMFGGDYPALCKVGGLKDGGYSGCRHHVMQLELHRRGPNAKMTLQYTNTRLHARHPPPRRTCENLLSVVTDWREMPDNIERSEIGRKGGISGHSILWRLYHLYAFDLSLDLVHDVMHTIVLCVFKKYIQLLLKFATRLGLLKDLEEALAIATKHRPAGLGGRWPTWPWKVKSMKFYRAEECQLLIMWCLLYVLEHLNFSKHTVLGGVGVILIDIGRLFYSHSRRHGWTNESIQLAKKLLAAWRVRIEESVGSNSSPLEHVAGSGELLDDVVWHSCHDIFWCYAFEREVSTYMAIPTNMKLNESTYIKYFERVMFASSFLSIQMDKDGLLPQNRALRDLHMHLAKPRHIYATQLENLFECESWHGNRVVITHSQDKARDLSRLLNLVASCACKSMVEEKGILVGRKEEMIEKMDKCTIECLKKFWKDAGILTDQNSRRFKEDVSLMKFLLFRGRKYKVQSNVIVKPDVPNSSHAWSWKANILGFFVHEFVGNMQVFFSTSYYDQRLAEAYSTMPLVHKGTGMQILDYHPSETSIMHVSHLMYEFMPLPMLQTRSFNIFQSRREFMIALELEDVTPRLQLLRAGELGCCPPYRECGDVMLLKTEEWESVEDPFQYVVVRVVPPRPALLEEINDIDACHLVEQDAFVGTVELNCLHRMGPRTRRYYARVGTEVTCSWHQLVDVLSNLKAIRYEFENPVEWMMD